MRSGYGQSTGDRRRVNAFRNMSVDRTRRSASPGKEDANALVAFDPTAALARLADGTGGEFVEDTNDLDGAVRQLSGEMHDYYRLSYRPTDQMSDRRYRHIAVKVSVPGAVVRTRSGYSVDSERGQTHRCCNLPPLRHI